MPIPLSKPKMRIRHATAFLLPFLLIIFFHDICFFGKSLSTSSFLTGTTPEGPYGFSGHRPKMPFSFDTGGNAWVNEPNPYIVRKILDEGALPTWNPYEGLGMPLIANMNNEVFNPLKVFLNLFPNPFFQDMFFLLRLLVMGLFTYLFLREMKLSKTPALLGSSFFMLSGYSVWWINLHPLSTVMYIPAIFYFYERWSERKDLKSAFFMSLFVCFALTAGKIPDVIVGLCLLFLYAMCKGVIKDSLKGLYREGGKVILVTLSGALLAAIALVPFIELYSNASPLAKAIRTGAASHTIPLITSVSLFQPLFLGWGNYFYGSWLKWTPQVILPHASVITLTLVVYAALNRSTLKKSCPFFIFSLFLFSVIYGLLPSHIISRLPIIGSIEFLKYNAMFYFSLAVISASAFDHLFSKEGSKKKFIISIGILSLIILAYFFSLYEESPLQMKRYMTAVLLLSLFVLFILGLTLHFSKKRLVFGLSVFLLLVFELFFYMPKDHPDRTDPYRRPTYLDVIKDDNPYRFVGDGGVIPPLVSSAMGLYDIRAISVLLPRDYYIFFENLLGFSVPQTNNPNPLFSATSPLIDLVGVKYILSRELLDHQQLEGGIRSHIASVRWVRFFDAMNRHSIRGGATYGFFNQSGEGRFSFFFARRFVFRTKLRISEPFLFTGFALKDFTAGATARIRITVENDMEELLIEGGHWNDRWMDVSRYKGKDVTLRIEGDGGGGGSIVLGDFGLTPGYEEERDLYGKLLMLHKREYDFLEYKGAFDGIHIYENKNVMGRAFVLHRVKEVSGLDDIIKELQRGADFRKIGLVSDITPEISRRMPALFSEESSHRNASRTDDKIIMRRYAPAEISMEVESNGGILVLNDLYYPGWKVSVNGKEEKVIKAFGLFRGVLIGKGKSEVLFSYRPMSFYAGIIISAATFIAWSVVALIWRRRRT